MSDRSVAVSHLAFSSTVSASPAAVRPAAARIPAFGLCAEKRGTPGPVRRRASAHHVRIDWRQVCADPPIRDRPGDCAAAGLRCAAQGRVHPGPEGVQDLFAAGRVKSSRQQGRARCPRAGWGGPGDGVCIKRSRSCESLARRDGPLALLRPRAGAHQARESMALRKPGDWLQWRCRAFAFDLLHNFPLSASTTGPERQK